jgi:cytidyltransferase-like protein
MFVADLFEDTKNLVVVYPGRFQPFHKGHKAVYDHLAKKFGRDRVYIATSNKVDPPKSPFNFADKSVFMALTGVPMDRVIESREPYKVPELTANYPAESTILIFAVSEKDMAEDPRFRMGTKRDGSPTYFQPLPTDLKDANTFDKTGYILTVPTVDFTVLGTPMRSATEVRQQYKDADPATRKKIIADLFGRYSEEAQHIMDQKLVVTEGWKQALGAAAMAAGLAATPAKAEFTPRDALVALRMAKNIQGINKDSVKGEIDQEIRAIARGDRNASAVLGRGQRDLDRESEWLQYKDLKRQKGIKEDAAGVGVVASNKKMARDPRYSTSMTVDVRPDTLKKMMRAFHLIESLYSRDPESPMTSSEVLIPGYGRMSIEALHKTLKNRFQDLADKMASMEPDQARQAQYLVKKSPLPVMLDSLVQAYRELSTQRRKGGSGSRGIPAGMFSDE